MRLLARAGVLAGESGVAGLAGCLLAAADPAAREVLGLGEASRVLVFSTEGATDPELYARLRRSRAQGNRVKEGPAVLNTNESHS